MHTSNHDRSYPHSTSKASQKLKVLPEEPSISRSTETNDLDEDDDDEDDDEEEEDDDIAAPRSEVYQQIAKIPAGAPRKDARLLTKKEKERLPREYKRSCTD